MATKAVAARLSARALSQEGLDKFRANRRWLQNAVSEFSPYANGSGCLQPLVLLYGSSVSGTAFCDGDADFAVVFPQGKDENNIPAVDKRPVVEVKREKQEVVLADLFRHIGSKTADETLKPQRIFHARVPIVQYLRITDSGDPLKFDVSLSLDGVKNSLLLRKYMEQSPRLHLGVMCVKQWGREQKILTARRGWISPYALTIMYIHFMAATQRIPGLLDETAVDLFVRDVLTASITDQSLLDRVPELNTALRLGETDTAVVAADVQDFFSFFGDPTQFDFDTSVVDVRKNGTITEKEEWLAVIGDMAQQDRWHLLGHENVMIRDPYESHNLGRSVDFFKGEAIREAFRVASVKKEPISFLATS